VKNTIGRYQLQDEMMLELLDNHLAKIYKAATKNMLQ
jgi:hypothetical protein